MKNTIYCKHYYIHSPVLKNQVCSSCVIDNFLTTKQSRNWSDDKVDEYDSEVYALSFPNCNAQNLRRIKQRKGHCFIQALSDDENDKDDDFITPYTFQNFRPPSVSTTSEHPCWSLCADLWAFSKEIGKYPP